MKIDNKEDKDMYNLHLNEKNDNSLKNDHIFNFLTINFCENLQEYFFVRNQFLIIIFFLKR